MHLCKEQQDIRTMNTMLTYLGGYGIDHHTRSMIDLMPFLIEKNIPCLLQYLNSRLLQTEYLKTITKGVLKEKNGGMTETQIWFKQSDFNKKLIKSSSKKGKQEIERPIKVEFIDLPCVYNYNEELCTEFFGRLADSENFALFENKAVKKLIEFNYPIVKLYTIKKLFFPFVLF